MSVDARSDQYGFCVAVYLGAGAAHEHEAQRVQQWLDGHVLR